MDNILIPSYLDKIPGEPGCYLFKDEQGKIIYVGKAKDLRKRVSQYFQKKDHDPKTHALVSALRTVDAIVAPSEVDALILENSLIKRHQPKYNINLKDAKQYAYIRVTKEEFARLEVARDRTLPGEYVGPFVSGSDRIDVMDAVTKALHLRTCRKLPKRACIRYHIGICDAPCIGNISREEYAKNIHQALTVLQGKTKGIIADLKKGMEDASLAMDYERAMRLRDQAIALESLEFRQTMQRGKAYDEDVIDWIANSHKTYVVLFHVYKGTLAEKQEFVLESADMENTGEDVEEFLVQYYSEERVPKEIILRSIPTDTLAEFLKRQKKERLILTIPRQGEKKVLLDLARRNLELSFFGDTAKVVALQDALTLNESPSVIECFDISHLSGTLTVASLVQFRNGKPDKGNYRRFRIRSVEGIDDFAAMREVVSRRYARLKEEGTAPPNLVMVDGGIGQLGAALDALRSIDVKLPVIALAKKFEEVYLPGSSAPIRLPRKDKARLFLQEIRDEAHRFAIAYNKLLRKKKMKE